MSPGFPLRFSKVFLPLMLRLTFDPTITVITNSIQTHTSLPVKVVCLDIQRERRVKLKECNVRISFLWNLGFHCSHMLIGLLPLLCKCLSPCFCSPGDLWEHSWLLIL